MIFRTYFLGILGWVVYRIMFATWRLKVEEPPELQQLIKEKKPFILAHWHGDEIALFGLVPRYRLATITSQSKDGSMMDLMLRLQGTKTSRGSSTRGAVGALKGLIQHAKKGYNCSYAVDGPKGPLHKAKAGVFETSRVINAPIFVAGVACDRQISFEKSWNKTFLPKIFSRVHVIWRGPFPALSRDQDPRDPQLALALEKALFDAGQEARASIGLPPLSISGFN